MNKNKPTFTQEFWKSFDSLGIYSKEDGPLLSDQLDSGVAGGKNPSDDNSEKQSETNEQNNDINMDMGTSSDFSSDMGGTSDFGGSDDTSTEDDSLGSGDTGASGNTVSDEPENPNENPFKSDNGKSLLDNQVAELQAAVADTLQRIYSNPKVDTVVVSELEALLDSIRNIREIIYLIPIEQGVYKYKLATISYAKLSQQLVEELKAEIKKL